jgi:secretion/DNA translocation related TadE-like protein
VGEGVVQHGPAHAGTVAEGSDRERGSITVVAAAGIALVLALVLLTVDAARLLATAARAGTAADAAALAAAQELAFPAGEEPEAVAARFAAANGAELVSCDCPSGGSEAVVQVRVVATGLFLLPEGRSITASARAVVELSAAPRPARTDRPNRLPPGRDAVTMPAP